jgi:hypothetical protein
VMLPRKMTTPRMWRTSQVLCVISVSSRGEPALGGLPVGG